MSSQFYSGNDLDGQTLQIQVEGDRIVAVRKIPHQPEFPYLLPVLVDLQHNGAMGKVYDRISGPEELNLIAETLLHHGVGRCLPTLVQQFTNEHLASMRLLESFRMENVKLKNLFPGYFHEGIFLSPLEGWRGAHPAENLNLPDWDMFQKIDDALGGHIHTVNIAPELTGALDFIDRAVAAGKKVALGHCCPSPEVIREAVRRGADRVTHFGNGAAPMIHRFHNPFWEFLRNDNLKLGLICDGFHLPPEIVETALKIKGRENCLPVSDASCHSGLPPGKYEHGTITMEENGFLHMTGQEILAGSSVQQDSCVNFLMEKLGFSMTDAWRQCSLIPAAAAGIELPRLEVGAEASFVIAENCGNQVFIRKTVFLGNVY